MGAGHLAGGEGGGAGGDAVVDEEHRASGQRGARATLSEAVRLPGQLGLLAVLDGVDIGAGDVAHADDVVAEHLGAALADGAEAQLPVVRDAELADDDHVQGCVQGAGHLVGDDHAATRQAEHDGVVEFQMPQPLGELPSGIRAVCEVHGSTPASGEMRDSLRPTLNREQQATGRDRAMSVLVGTSGWQYRDWRGVLYPPQVPQRLWLEEYARRFGTVESNNAFYRLPSRELFASWREHTPEGFVMAVKASRYLTHMKRLRDPEEPVRRLLTHAEGLGDRLGPVLLQLPPNLRADARVLEACLYCFPEGVRVAVEPRHASWWTPRSGPC